MRIGILGPLEIDGASVSLGRRDRAVLTVLALRAGDFVAADTLSSVLWPDEVPASWNKVIQGCIVRLRKRLGQHSIETLPAGYRLCARRDDVDFHRFERLVEQARQLDRHRDSDRIDHVLTEAMSLWRGPGIAELDDAAGFAAERERLLDLRLLVEEDHLEARLRARRQRDVANDARVLVAAAPLRERRWTLLALAHYRNGRQADSLRTLHRARKFLADELGLEPGPELIELEQKILQHDVSLLDDRPPNGNGLVDAAADACPYRGLLPFDIDDGDVFFGRAQVVRACLDRLADSGAVVVVGPSGSGKSSLVRAGIGAALRRDGRDVRVMSPGATPVDTFRRTAQSADARTVIIVDQLEEIFAQADPAEIAAFVEQLQTWCKSAQLVIALRADHLARVGAYRPLAEIAERSLVLLGPLANDDLRMAIESPAQLHGLRIEPGLVELLVHEAEGERGALPLLSHALRATWHLREGVTLTIAGYQQTGGLRDAIAQSAEAVYIGLTDDRQRVQMKLLFLRLFDRNTSGDPVRAPLPRSLLDDNSDRVDLVDKMIRARLLVSDEAAVNVAHESLAIVWPRLHQWLDDEVDDERRLHHLAAAATAWTQMGEPQSELYRGPRLEAVAPWRTERAGDLTADERSFLDASMELGAHERDAVARELAIRTRHNRRLRAAVTGVGCLLVISVLVGVALVAQTRRARNEGSQARAATAHAQAAELTASATAMTATARDVAALLSIEATRMAPGPQSRSALFGQFTADPGFEGYVQVHDIEGEVSGAVALDNKRVLLADGTGTVRTLNVAGGSPPDEHFPKQSSGHPSKLVISADGKVLAQLVRGAVDDPSRVQLYDIASLSASESILVAGDPTDVALSPDGAYVVVAGGQAGGAQIVRVDDRSVVGTIDSADLRSVPRALTSAAVTFDAAGHLYMSTLDGTVRIIDVPSLKEVGRLPPPIGIPATTRSLKITTDGRALVGSGYLDNTDVGAAGIAVWNLADRHARWVDKTSQECASLAVAAPSDTVYCADFFGSINSFDLTTGRQLDTHLDFQQGAVAELLTTPDSTALVAVGATSRTLGTWRVDGTGPIARTTVPLTTAGDYNSTGTALRLFRLDRPDDSPFWPPVLVDPSTGTMIDALSDLRGATWIGDHRFATFFTDGTAGTYDTQTGRRTIWPSVTFASTPVRSTYDPVRSVLLVWLTDGGSTLVDTSAGKLLPLQLPRGLANGSGFTADGRFIVAATDTGTSTYDTTTGQRVAGPLPDMDNLAVSSTGVVAASTPSGEIRFLDPGTLSPLSQSIKGAGGAIQHLEFSADGRTLMTRGGDAVRLFDVATGTQIGGKINVVRPDPDEGAALRPDGLQLAVATMSGVTIWSLDPADWVAAACRRAGRNLTRQEWTHYIGTLAPYRATCPDYPIDASEARPAG